MGLREMFQKTDDIARPAEDATMHALTMAKQRASEIRDFHSDDLLALRERSAFAIKIRELARLNADIPVLAEECQKFADDLSIVDTKQPSVFPLPLTLEKFWELLEERVYEEYLRQSREKTSA